MVSIPEYIIKLSVSLAVLYIFYRTVLNRLTFYQWNRIYLLGYSLLSFILPFINIGPWIEKRGMESPLNKIPALGNYSLKPAESAISWTIAEWSLVVLLSGILFLCGRLLMSYLSLKRLPQYSITNNFSLPSLKKRIIMMNKMKTATIHLGRFLFALPLLSVVLLAFRNENKQITERNPEIVSLPVIRIDTVPDKAGEFKTVTGFPDTSSVAKPHKNRYTLSVVDNAGECVVIIKNNKQKIVKAVTLTDWNADKAQNEKKYGHIADVATTDLHFRTGFRIADGYLGQKPIYVVNGIIQGPAFALNSLQLPAIQSVTVLKGADATKRYGENATDGVVIIELKPKDVLKTDTINLRLKADTVNLRNSR